MPSVSSLAKGVVLMYITYSVSEKAQDQLRIVSDTLNNIEDMSVRMSNINTTLENIEHFVGDTAELTEDGSNHLDKYIDQMDVISSNLNETTSFIDTLNSHLKEIDQVGKLIIGITEQLKLLSLNSSVEAARAGEAGRGFVVVAQEMNKLSSATRESIGQINMLLQNIMSSNEQVSKSIGSVSDSFNTSKEIFSSVKESFDTINKNAKILNNDMKKVHEEARLVSDNAQDMNEQGHILHDSSHEISSITQDVAAVTQEELAENEEINNQIQSLQKLIFSIESLLKRYKTSVTPVAQAS
jgi:methyl-accepting chemotaxis protein